MEKFTGKIIAVIHRFDDVAAASVSWETPFSFLSSCILLPMFNFILRTSFLDDCLAVIREGLVEFPRNERLLITLAETLSEAGWRRHKE